MTKREGKPERANWKAVFAGDQDYLRRMIEAVVQSTLEAEMSAALGAENNERSAQRLGYRSGCYPRSLITGVGTLELRVPQDPEGRFSTELFERYQRAETITGGRPGGDVRARSFHPQGQGGHRVALRA